MGVKVLEIPKNKSDGVLDAGTHGPRTFYRRDPVTKEIEVDEDGKEVIVKVPTRTVEFWLTVSGNHVPIPITGGGRIDPDHDANQGRLVRKRLYRNKGVLLGVCPLLDAEGRRWVPKGLNPEPCELGADEKTPVSNRNPCEHIMIMTERRRAAQTAESERKAKAYSPAQERSLLEMQKGNAAQMEQFTRAINVLAGRFERGGVTDTSDDEG